MEKIYRQVKNDFTPDVNNILSSSDSVIHYPKGCMSRYTREQQFEFQNFSVSVQCPRMSERDSSSRDVAIDDASHHAESKKGKFKCEECNMIFNQHRNYTNHLRTHSGSKPFKCNDCGKSFAQSRNLRVHKRLHSGERPYKCDDCDKSFASSQRLKLHKKEQH